ncbi:hypothetical protein DFH07DRAFT_847128 [Mycena maculata]|uniref:Extracellular membrane protein CFEM domain-containing protein n=1 Tax=Mycena maculata TaxID=230809 RepID=A0AAD7HZN2_9AGAR|nr:hypothetical protein DFH07DRAFT_847128 [Mycena maculata]
MLSSRFPALFVACCLLPFQGALARYSLIPGLSWGQANCLSSCLIHGLPTAPNCNINDYILDASLCFCSSAAFVANLTQCAAADCNVCMTGKCNVTASPFGILKCGSLRVNGTPVLNMHAHALMTGSASSPGAGPSAAPALSSVGADSSDSPAPPQAPLLAESSIVI